MSNPDCTWPLDSMGVRVAPRAPRAAYPENPDCSIGTVNLTPSGPHLRTGAQDFADFAINPRGFFGCGVDKRDPLLVLLV